MNHGVIRFEPTYEDEPIALGDLGSDAVYFVTQLVNNIAARNWGRVGGLFESSIQVLEEFLDRWPPLVALASEAVALADGSVVDDDLYYFVVYLASARGQLDDLCAKVTIRGSGRSWQVDELALGLS